jgi:signal transduction histidine kinase
VSLSIKLRKAGEALSDTDEFVVVVVVVVVIVVVIVVIVFIDVLHSSLAGFQKSLRQLTQYVLFTLLP